MLCIEYVCFVKIGLLLIILLGVPPFNILKSALLILSWWELGLCVCQSQWISGRKEFPSSLN